MKEDGRLMKLPPTQRIPTRRRPKTTTRRPRTKRRRPKTPSSQDAVDLRPIAVHPAISYRKHLAKYRRILERAASERTAIPDHQAFEYAWALKLKYLVYRDVPPNYIRACGIEDTRNFGTDLVSCDRKGSAQVKLYGDTTGVTFQDMAKFYTHSDLLGATERRALCTTPGAPITRNARNVADLRDIEIWRSSLDDLVQDALAVKMAEEEVAPSSWAWGRGQLEARDALLASDEQTFRAQLPCGYGKTALIALVVASRTANHKLLVLVPSKDLIHQTAERLRALMGVETICKVGDGGSDLDPAADVVVAAHAHLTRGTLDGTKWSLVVVDEAHHCVENGARAKLDALDSQRFLELSATFPKGVHVHFKVSMREAIDEGVVSYYRVRVVELTAEGEKRAALLATFRERYVEWGPTLAVFNDVQGTRDFARALREAGIEAKSVDANTPASVRKQIAERLETGETSVVCCCGCWNEGVDISALRSVVFCDARNSDVNKRQLAQRASRLHGCKPYYNIVLFVREELDDVEGLLRSFAEDDPAFRASAHAAFGMERGPVDSRITVQAGSADVLSDMLLTRLGEVLLGKRHLGTQEKVDMVIALGARPKRAEMLGRFVSSIRGNWIGKKVYTDLTPEQMSALEASWMRTLCAKWKAPKLTFAQKMQCVGALDKKPARSEVTNFNIGVFVNGALQNTTRGSGAYKALLKVKWFADALADLERAKANPEPPEKQKIAWLIEHGKKHSHNTAPLEKQFEGRTYQFKIADFWSKIVIKAAGGKASAARKVLEQHAWYTDAVKKLQAKRSKNSLGNVPVDQQIEWLVELGRKPTGNETIPEEYIGKDGPWHAGSFWFSVQGNWTGARCNKLSPERKRRLDPCVREWIAKSCASNKFV
jgi:superfamily II DNA or RNA helicase